MKKLLFVFIFLLSFTLIACKSNNEDKPIDEVSNKVVYSITNFSLDDTNNTIKFNVNINSTKRNDIVYSLTYAFFDSNSNDEIEYLSLKSQESKTVLKGDSSYSYKIALTEDEFLLELSIKIEVVNPSYEYEKPENTVQGVVSLAQNYNKGENSLADEIIEKFNGLSEIKVSNLYLNIDYSNKKATSASNGFTCEATFNTDTIVIEITFDAIANLTVDYQNLPVYVNGKTASGTLYTENGKYYYSETNYEVKQVELTFDLIKHSEEVSGSKYQATMSNPDYNKITVTLTLNESYYFASNFKLYLNDKLVEDSKYTIKDNVLTYIFDDPNWSEFY